MSAAGSPIDPRMLMLAQYMKQSGAMPGANPTESAGNALSGLANAYMAHQMMQPQPQQNVQTGQAGVPTAPGSATGLGSQGPAQQPWSGQWMPGQATGQLGPTNNQPGLIQRAGNWLGNLGGSS